MTVGLRVFTSPYITVILGRHSKTLPVNVAKRLGYEDYSSTANRTVFGLMTQPPPMSSLAPTHEIEVGSVI